MGNPAVLGIQNIVGPKLAHTYADGGILSLRRAVWKLTALMLITTVPFCIIIMCFAENLLRVLYGSKYSGDSAIVVILAIGISTTALAFGPSRALFAIERSDIDMMVSVTALVMLLAVGVWLTRTFGVIGAGYAMLISSVASLVLRSIAFSFVT